MSTLLRKTVKLTRGRCYGFQEASIDKQSDFINWKLAIQNEQGTINKRAATARKVISVCKIIFRFQKARLMKGFFNI